ncbi:MAG TPA: DUF1844 domain-containing protein [Fimbriimonadaceae bacterium]|nr:DUF1844 domain-containing protein [Fimbriimonadaceae bacterium]
MADEPDPETKEPLSVYAVLATFVDQMSAIAWQKLGLQHDFITGKLEPDIDQARVAIDVVAKLVDALESECDEADRRQLQNLVRDLRMNFVSRQKQ